MDHEELEGIARAVLEETCTVAPVDAGALACAMNVEVRSFPGHEAFIDLLRPCIYMPSRPMRDTRRHGTLGHELGHLLLREHGHDYQDEHAAAYLAGALLVPRETLDRQLRESWSVRRLRALHPNASHEMLVRRVTQLRPAVATVIDAGKVTARAASPWLEPARVAPVRVWELTLVQRALVDGETIEDGPSVATHAGGDRVVAVTRRWFVERA
jgi:Zn-dependent peptidase ImmA (M78 family)